MDINSFIDVYQNLSTCIESNGVAIFEEKMKMNASQAFFSSAIRLRNMSAEVNQLKSLQEAIQNIQKLDAEWENKDGEIKYGLLNKKNILMKISTFFSNQVIEQQKEERQITLKYLLKLQNVIETKLLEKEMEASYVIEAKKCFFKKMEEGNPLIRKEFIELIKVSNFKLRSRIYTYESQQFKTPMEKLEHLFRTFDEIANSPQVKEAIEGGIIGGDDRLELMIAMILIYDIDVELAKIKLSPTDEKSQLVAFLEDAFLYILKHGK